MNKKGQNVITESLQGLTAMFAFVLVAIILSMVLVGFNQQASAQDEFQTQALSGTMTKMLEYPVYMDLGALFLYAVLWIASVWILSRLETEPLVYLISWMGIIGLSVVSIAVGYGLDQIVSSALVTDATQYMIFIPFYSANAFIFGLLYIFSCAIALHYPKQ